MDLKTRIADWFLLKNFTRNEQLAIETAETWKILRETEKALLIKAYGKFPLVFWVPKSLFN